MKRRPGNTILQKTNNSIEDLVGNEENEYSVLDPKRTMINITNELSDAQKKISGRKDISSSQDEITEKFMEKLQDMVNQKVKDALKKYQDTTNKNLEKTQKQLNELREKFTKLQSETKETIKKEIYEVKKTT
jgi:hypothetical protein